jgi:hypothetical protein
MSFQASEAAFDGFRLTRHHPRAVLAWAGTMLAANLAASLMLSVVGGEKWRAFEAAATAKDADLDKLSGLLGGLTPALLLAFAIQVAAAAVVHASVLRALLKPSEHARLRIGRDEARIAILFGLSFATSIGLTAAVGFVTGILSIAGLQNAVLSALLGLLASIALTIRLSLSGPMTIAQKQVRFWASWRATRGYGWALAGSEALALVFAVVVALLVITLTAALIGLVVALAGFNLADLRAVAPDSGIGVAVQVVYALFLSLLYVLVLAILAAPPVALHRHLTNGEGWEEGAGI